MSSTVVPGHLQTDQQHESIAWIMLDLRAAELALPDFLGNQLSFQLLNGTLKLRQL